MPMWKAGQAARENVPEAMRAILSQLGSMGMAFLDDSFLEETWPEILKKHGGFEALDKTLTNWVEKTNHPIVLLLDEIDSLVGDTLISVLRQLRTGYTKRPALFPAEYYFMWGSRCSGLPHPLGSGKDGHNRW